MAKAPITIEEKRKPIVPLSERGITYTTIADLAASERPQVSNFRPTTPSVSQVFDNVEIIENNTIKLDRLVYSRKGFNNIVGIEFEEFQKKEDSFTPDQFIQLYDSLFFEIPKTGKNSHTYIARKSKNYLGNFTSDNAKDNIIDSLNEKILELEQQLLTANQTDPEHPFFRNGTLVGKKDSPDYYYMDKGFKRKINYTEDFHRVLIKVLGYNHEDYPDGPGWFPSVPNSVLSSIPTGPNLSEGNFEQSTYIENGELFIGNNVTDETKDAQIAILRARIKQIESGDFSTLPELDALSIDISEIDGIANDIRTRIDNQINFFLLPLPDFIRNSNIFQNFIDRVSETIAFHTKQKLLDYLNTANTI